MVDMLRYATSKVFPHPFRFYPLLYPFSFFLSFLDCLSYLPSQMLPLGIGRFPWLEFKHIWLWRLIIFWPQLFHLGPN
ncbi:hypothetical protein BDV26DRAFT_63047 [Aspergillus bertholletiae]|uniref:Uncharacterized protein n=1 Tax=Aspergillus bertholletiae TaxID=1226010 RepID=A0A5N7AUR3_9EURO|nr:hypothetical protein BDV26DRAFT_63047 [Aspergillus bertholletiae]